MPTHNTTFQHSIVSKRSKILLKKDKGNNEENEKNPTNFHNLFYSYSD